MFFCCGGSRKFAVKPNRFIPKASLVEAEAGGVVYASVASRMGPSLMGVFKAFFGLETEMKFVKMCILFCTIFWSIFVTCFGLLRSWERLAGSCVFEGPPKRNRRF